MLLSQHPSSAPVTPSSSKTSMMEQPVIIENQGEQTRWKLRATKAEQAKPGQKIQALHLTAPHLEIFNSSGESIPVQGDDAWFDPIKRSAHFVGHVTIDYQQWHLQSADALFDGINGVVHIKGAFTAHGDHVAMHGADLTVDQAQQRLEVRHHITIEDQR
ncbi:MAG: hypothetical protein R8J85_05780 [Mariprofundales bacterium]